MRAALALCVCVALRGGAAQSAARTECVQCGADPCLRTACTNGTCARDAMVAAARAAGYTVYVPGRCAVNRTYACAVNATGRSLSCDLAPDPAPTALLAAAPQLYPPNYMKKQFRPRYYSVPKEEADRGFTYDSLDKSGWAPMWTEGGQRKYFEPTWDFTTNRNENKWGEGDSYGLSTDQWLVLLTLLVLNGNPIAMTQSMLPLAVISMAAVLQPQRQVPAKQDPVPYPASGLTKVTKEYYTDQSPWG